MGLAVQHPLLRHADVEPLPCARDGHIHQPPLLLQPAVFGQAQFAGETAFFHAGEEYGIELQPFGRMHSHQLYGRFIGGGLVLARFKRSIAQKGKHGECRAL